MKKVRVNNIWHIMYGSGSSYMIPALGAIMRPDKEGLLEERANGPEYHHPKERFKSCGDYEKDLLALVNWGYPIVFSNCAEWGFFSRNNIEGVKFLIRHPWDCYQSYVKRHPENITIQEWAVRWDKILEEAHRCKGQIFRFETFTWGGDNGNIFKNTSRHEGDRESMEDLTQWERLINENG